MRGLPRRSLVAFRVESTRTGGGGAALHGAGAGAVLPAEHVQSPWSKGLVAGAAGGAPTLRVRLRPVEVWLSLRRLSAAEAAAATAESAAADAGGGGACAAPGLGAIGCAPSMLGTSSAHPTPRTHVSGTMATARGSARA